MLTDEDKTCMEHSGKLVLLFNILSLAQQMGDKVLVHAASYSVIHVRFLHGRANTETMA